MVSLDKKAQDALNLSMLKNPYVLAAAAIAGLAYGIYKLATAESETEKPSVKQIMLLKLKKPLRRSEK